MLTCVAAQRGGISRGAWTSRFSSGGSRGTVVIGRAVGLWHRRTVFRSLSKQTGNQRTVGVEESAGLRRK